MGIKDIIAKFAGKNSNKQKEFEEDQHIQERYFEKKKSANERELERFQKEMRENQIKKELEEFRNKRRDEINYGHQMLGVKNMFAGQGKTPEVMHNNHKLINGGNIFFK